MTPVLRWIAVVLLVALVAEGRASAFSVVLAAERFPRSPISAGSGGWRGSQPMTPGGERRVRYGYDVRTACCCTYDVAMSQAYLRNSCRARPGDLVAFSALVPGAHDCELLRLEFTGKERDSESNGTPRRGWITLGRGICRRQWGGSRAPMPRLLIRTQAIHRAGVSTATPAITRYGAWIQRGNQARRRVTTLTRAAGCYQVPVEAAPSAIATIRKIR